MNRLVMLSEISKEKKIVNSRENNELSKKLSKSLSEEYLDFNNIFFKNKNEIINSKESIENNYLIVDDKDNLNENLSRIFMLKNKKPFLEFVNEIFDDCLGTNCSVEVSSKKEVFENIEDGILESPSNRIKIFVEDDYRKFEYSIQFQTYDYDNIVIAIEKKDLSINCGNIISLSSKIKEYRHNNEKSLNQNKSDIYLIMVNSSIKVPDSYELSKDRKGHIESYKFNIFKAWKYGFNKLYEKNLYILFPLKMFDLIKHIDYMKNCSYSKEVIEKEIDRFFFEMNKYLNKLEEEKNINNEDVKEINLISKDIMSSINSHFIDI